MEIDDYIQPLRAGEHRLKKEHGLHTGKGMRRGGWWNQEWRMYKDKYPDATDEEILEHLKILEKKAEERLRKFKEMKRKSTGR